MKHIVHFDVYWLVLDFICVYWYVRVYGARDPKASQAVC